MFQNGQSTEYAGKCIVSLAQESNVMKYSSRVVISEDYGNSRGIKDIDGREIDSFRQLNVILKHILPPSLGFIAKLVPRFIKVPKFVITLLSSKF